MRTTALFCLAAALLSGAAPGAVQPVTAPAPPAPSPAAQSSAADLYATLNGLGFDSAAALAVNDVVIEHGPATLRLVRGTWVPLLPVDGRVTGAMFVGEGRFGYVPPEGVERDQLIKFADEPVLDDAFDEMYLRFTDNTAELVTGSPAAAGAALGKADDWHEEIREKLLDDERMNLDALLLADLIEKRDRSFFAWIDTDDNGRLSFRKSDKQADLYVLGRWSERYDMLDTWGGFGQGDWYGAVADHYVLDITLDGDDIEDGRSGAVFQATGPGTRVLHFGAHPLCEVKEVLDENGEPLFFVREEVDGDDYENLVTVVFPEDLPVDEPTRVTFLFGGDIIDELWGGGDYAVKAPIGWYPTLGYLSRATYEATFRVEDDHTVHASGDLISDEIVEGQRIFHFTQEFPVAFFSFNYGTMPTRVVEMDDVVPVTVFGQTSGFGGDPLRNVAVDVGNSIKLFEDFYGAYPFEYMSATRIPFSHGQGFPGLLHLAAGTFYTEIKGASEAFRGHEVAHQWWGHIVGWKTYRDQWISEGFAEYSGALYAMIYLDDADMLLKMTEAWRNDVLRKGNLALRQFGMDTRMTRFSQGSWSGPVTLGRRLISSEGPVDYQILVYEKGAYILHMLRMLMYDYQTDDDIAFRRMMRDFVATHRGGEASTEDFRAVVERHMGGDMSWFFEQWVYGTAIPEYEYAWRTTTGDAGQELIQLRIRQTVEPDVPFRMFVPVKLEFDGDQYIVFKVPVSQAEQVYTFEKPPHLDLDDVLLNPVNAVLAEVKEVRW